MKKMMFALTSLALALGPALAWSADQPSASQPGQASAADPNANPMIGGSQAAQTPPADWTNLKGTVQMVDASAKTVQIKDDSGQLLQVPVDRQVKIQKDGQNVKLSQLQTGDTITLVRNITNPEGTRTY